MITWQGSVVTPNISGKENGYIFAIANTFRSRCDINILRFVTQLDCIEFQTGVNRTMPLLKTYRCPAANITGGIVLNTRTPFDTALNSPDPGVVVRYGGFLHAEDADDLQVTGESASVWQQFTTRLTTGVGQIMTWDFSQIAGIAATEKFLLKPGEGMICQWVTDLGVGGCGFSQCMWEEDTLDTGYNIGGGVLLDSAPVPGAKIFVLTDTDRDMINPEVEVLTTDSVGAYQKKFATGVKAAVFVQYRDGEDKYTDEGKPYIEGGT